MRSTFFTIVTGLLLALPLSCQAAFEVDSSCPSSVSDAYREALVVATVASSSLAKKDPIDAGDVRGLYQALFDEADRAEVKGIFDKIARLSFSTTTIKFYCNEDTIHWDGPDSTKATDTTSMFYHSGFKDGNNDESQYLGLEANVQLPRKTSCEQGNLAYAINGQGGTPDLSNQVHIIICPVLLAPDNTKDRRRLTEIKTNGLDKNFYSLETIDPLSITILHELTHTTPVGGLDANGASIILDGPNGDTYGFAKCRDLRKSDSRAPVKTAESYAILGAGLFLQFPNKHPKFTWGTGAVNVDNGKTNYAPYVQQRTTPKRSVVFEKRVDGQLGARDLLDVGSMAMEEVSKRNIESLNWKIGGISDWKKWSA